MSKPPLWAQRIVTDVCAAENIEEPEVNWRRSRTNYWSSGQASRRHMTITAGTERKDQRLVLLHELSHVILMQQSNHDGHHPPELFAKVFELVWKYGPNIKWAKEREFSYRVAAKAGYKQYRAQIKEEGR